MPILPYFALARDAANHFLSLGDKSDYYSIGLGCPSAISSRIKTPQTTVEIRLRNFIIAPFLQDSRASGRTSKCSASFVWFCKPRQTWGRCQGYSPSLLSSLLPPLYEKIRAELQVGVVTRTFQFIVEATPALLESLPRSSRLQKNTFSGN